MSSLCDRSDFKELLEAAATYHDIADPAIIEKDYYVTEALRMIARDFGDEVIFKGGTSLSKGWKLIERFSEDIDLYVNPGDRGEKARTSLLKSLVACVDEHDCLDVDEGETDRVKGVARATSHLYTSIFADSRLPKSVRLEAGIQSGTQPSEVRELSSLIAEFLNQADHDLESADLSSFELTLLHFRRTFVEKMFAIHDKVHRGLLRDREPIGSYARHYYDLSQLVIRAEVIDMLQTDEYEEIARDYFRITSMNFPKQEFPDSLNLGSSQALYPGEDLKITLQAGYTEQCEALCYGEFPQFADVLSQFQRLREFIARDISVTH